MAKYAKSESAEIAKQATKLGAIHAAKHAGVQVAGAAVGAAALGAYRQWLNGGTKALPTILRGKINDKFS